MDAAATVVVATGGLSVFQTANALPNIVDDWDRVDEQLEALIGSALLRGAALADVVNEAIDLLVAETGIAEQLPGDIHDTGPPDASPGEPHNTDPTNGRARNDWSAEVTAIHPYGPDAEITLIVPSGPKPALAAALNAVILGRPIYIRSIGEGSASIEPITLPTDLEARVDPSRPRMVIAPVVGFTPESSKEDYASAMSSVASILGETVTDAQSRHPQSHIVFDLSGGFKQNIPAITLMLQFLAAAAPETVTVSAHAQFKDSTPRPLPLSPSLISTDVISELRWLARQGSPVNEQDSGLTPDGFIVERNERGQLLATRLAHALLDMNPEQTDG